MYTVPADFAARLHREFDGRLRLRWSNARHEFHLEQKVRRGLADGLVRDTHDDAGIRRRDGYLYILSIRPGTRMPCPRCASELQVPVHEIREVSCGYCKLKGQEHRVAAGFFPLNDSLIDYLKRLDPEREASRRLRQQVDGHNLATQTRLEQSVSNATTDAANDDFNRIAGIPSVGYTGKEFRG
jgi:hypothetical protein